MEDNIKVVLRTRPLNKRESSAQCTNVVRVSEADNSILLNCKPDAKQFTFDHVVGAESSQDSVFRAVGVPLTESCLKGFNGTIIAYGQTGSGKTHTLFGSGAGSTDSGDNDLRGLVPRVFEYLWQKIAAAEGADAAAPVYSCRCSFYEIYNERVYDLLHRSGGPALSGTAGAALNIREDQNKGVYVDGLTEEAVNSPEAAKSVLNLGYRNRHVSATAMNRDSSRSHAVFLLTIAVTQQNEEGGVALSNTATFSLVDLAGSERQKSTQAEGMRLKEASKINQSLSTLGSVIHALSIGGNASKFVRYRDSALTFLLRDSLGGNSKTVLIANVSPSSDSLNETLGTLKFASRAKTVRNTVSANVFATGTVESLQREIRLLREQLADYQSNQGQGSLQVHSSTDDRLSVGSSCSRNSCTSSGGTNCGSLPSPSPAAAALASLNDKSLLSAALRRFEKLDGSRVRAELRAHLLGKQLEHAEAEVHAMRLDGQAEKWTDEVVSAAAQIGDHLRLKDQVEQLTRKLGEYESSGSRGEEPWAKTEEAAFTEAVMQRLEETEKRLVLLDQQWSSSNNSAFEATAGMTPIEAINLQERVVALTQRAEQAEQQTSVMRMTVLELEQAAAAISQPGQEQEGLNHAIAPKQMGELQNRVGMLEADLLSRELSPRPSAEKLTEAQGRVEAACARVAQLEQELCASRGVQLQLQIDLQTRTFERDQELERAETAEAAAASCEADLAATRRMVKTLSAQLEAIEENDARAHVDAIELQSQLAYESERRVDLSEKLQAAAEQAAMSQQVVLELQEQVQQFASKAEVSSAEAKELAHIKQELLVAAADREHEHGLVLEQLATAKQQLAVLAGAAIVRSSPATAPDGSLSPIEEGRQQKCSESDNGSAEGQADASDKDALIQRLRSELLQALQKVNQSSQIRTNLITCQDELQSLRTLYEKTKNAAVEAESRASAMMAQLLDVSKALPPTPRDGADASGAAAEEKATHLAKELKCNQEALAKEQRRAKKLLLERDASRDVLSELELEVTRLRARVEGDQGALSEVRQENTKLRECVRQQKESNKLAESQTVSALQAAVKQRDAKIEQLRRDRESARAAVQAEKAAREEAERLAMSTMSSHARSKKLHENVHNVVTKMADNVDVSAVQDGDPPFPPPSVSTRRRGLSTRSANVTSRGSSKGEPPQL